MTTIRQDIRYGIRTLRDRPAFTLVATLSLALGIGANATIFSIINATLLAPLGLAHEERLVALTTHPLDVPNNRGSAAYREFEAWREAESFEAVGAIWTVPEILGGDSDGTSAAEDVLAIRGGPRLFEVLDVKPQLGRLNSAQTWANFHLAFMERLRALPGVETVGIVENFPLDEGFSTIGFTPEPTAAGGTPSELQLNLTFTAGDYFEAMGIALLQGRTFTDDEQRVNPGYIVISKSTAERLWPGEDPLGKRLTLNQFDLHETVIGVVEDVRQGRFDVEGGPNVYFPLVSQKPEIWTMSTPAYVLKTPRADSIGSEVRALVREVAPEAPMYRVYTIEALVARSMAQLTFTMVVLALAAGLALLLGMVGLYGILSSSIAERTRELGVRIALGAPPKRVRRMVVTQGLRVVALGLVVGLVVVLFGARALDSLLYGVRSLDAVTLLATSLLMLLVGMAACWIPAHRASAVDPARTLAEG